MLEKIYSAVYYSNVIALQTWGGASEIHSSGWEDNVYMNTICCDSTNLGFMNGKKSEVIWTTASF